MKEKILKCLREAEDYVSGQELCRMLDVSRTAIWKVMNQLKDEGYVIDAVKNKGYKLIQTPDLVTAEEVDSLLETEWAGHPVVCTKRNRNQRIRQPRCWLNRELPMVCWWLPSVRCLAEADGEDRGIHRRAAVSG